MFHTHKSGGIYVPHSQVRRDLCSTLTSQEGSMFGETNSRAVGGATCKRLLTDEAEHIWKGFFPWS